MAETAGPASGRWQAVLGRLGGVRVRAALVATLVVALILGLSGWAFVVIQGHQLEATTAGVADQQAADVAAQVTRLGAAAADVTPSGAGEQSFVQVVSGDGTVLAASPAVAGRPPLLDARPAPGQTVTRTLRDLPIGEENAFAVAARGIRAPDGAAVVIAARSLETVQQATSVLVRLLVVGYPIVLLLVAATSYWLTGLALAPVEAMRRRVAGISSADLDARVPVPSSRDSVAELATTMNAMLDGLAASGHAQRRFVADASHELRSPLATIRAAHEIAVAHPEVSDWKAVSADVLAEVQRLEGLVDDLLFLARADERGAQGRREEVDLDDLVAAEAGRLSRATQLRIVPRTVPVRVTADPDGVARLLRNLADNAARHARSCIALGLSRQGDAAVVDVVDDGPGIPTADRERAFERFVRLDPSRRRDAGGAGLGLAIAREIARAHGGEVTALPHDGGAHLQLRLPLQSRDCRGPVRG